MNERDKAALAELEAMKVWIEGRIENVKAPHCIVCGAVLVETNDPELMKCLSCGHGQVSPL